MMEVSDKAREDLASVVNHLSTSIWEMVDAIDHANIRRNHLQDLIGDVRAFREDSGDSTLTLVGAFQNLASPPHIQVIDKGGGVEDMKRLMDEIDKDMIHNFTLLNDRVKTLERQSSTAPTGRASLGTLDLDAPVVDGHSLQATTIRGILGKNARLTRENVSLESRLNQLSAYITSQGGAVLGQHMFLSEEMSRTLHCSSAHLVTHSRPLWTPWCSSITMQCTCQ